MPTIEELGPQCLTNALQVARRRAAQSCARHCRLDAKRCDSLAEDAVSQALVELLTRQKSFESCDHFRALLIQQSQWRAKDYCEQASRGPRELPIESPTTADPEAQQRRRAHRADHPEPSRFLDLDDPQLAAFRHCRDNLSPADQRIIDFMEKIWTEEQKNLPLDRISEVMQHLYQDAELWAFLELPPVDWSRPHGAAYQRLRSRLLKVEAQLRSCLKQQFRPEQEGQS